MGLGKLFFFFFLHILSIFSSIDIIVKNQKNESPQIFKVSLCDPGIRAKFSMFLIPLECNL